MYINELQRNIKFKRTSNNLQLLFYAVKILELLKIIEKK